MIDKNIYHDPKRHEQNVSQSDIDEAPNIIHLQPDHKRHERAPHQRSARNVQIRPA